MYSPAPVRGNRFWLTILLAAIAALAALVWLPGAAEAQSFTASISGTVTDDASTPQPIEQICVEAEGLDTGDFGFAETDSNGDYEIPDLEGGQNYRVFFSDCNDIGAYLDEYYDNKADETSADPVTVADGAAVTGIDAALASASSIAGTVTGSGAGNPPLEDVCVTVSTVSPREEVEFGSTDGDGKYSIEVPAGTYRVEFDPSCGPLQYLGEWFDNQPSFNTATDVVVGASGATTANAQLALGGIISGTVTGNGGAALVDICVTAYDPNHDAIGFAATDASGDYSIVGLQTGSYKVEFDASCADSGYLSEWWDGKVSFNTADPIAVVAGETDTADATLTLGGSITGQVTADAGGANLANICVEVHDQNFDLLGFDETDASGNYSVGGLESGNYFLFFDADCGPGNFVSEYWDNTLDPDEADPIAVTVGTATTGKNAGLATGATISGTVTNTAGTPAPIGGVCVTAEQTDGSGFGFDSTDTDSNGTYTLNGLPAGTYKVFFEGDCAGNFLSEYWDNKPDFDAADPITLTVGQTRTGINAQLAAGGKIAGTVTGAGGAGALVGACVSAVDSVTGDNLGFATTGAGGAYEIQALPTGSYKVLFSPCGAGNFISEYYNNKADFDSADQVSVTAGSTTGAINATLEVGAIISGTVTMPGGGAIEGVCVNVVSSTDEDDEVGSDFTNATGQYEVNGLRAGSYKVMFDGSCGGNNFIDEWWNNQPNFTAATVITLAAGATQSNVNAQLAPGGSVSGTVTNQSGAAPLGDMCVTALNPSDENDELGLTVTDSDGTYTLAGLPPGNVKLLFEDCASGNFISEYFNNKTTFASADLVAVTAGGNTTGRNAQLIEGGRITGHLTGGGDPTLEDICVTAFDAGTGTEMAFDVTDNTGDYTLRGLPTGSYKVEFDPCGVPGFGIEYYNNKPNLASADPVAVTAPSITPNIDADLDPPDTTPPTVSVTGGPTGPTTDRRPVFTFTAEVGATVQCSIDTGTPSFGACSGATSHQPATDLADGSYTFRVQATDAAGNQATATRSFSVTSTGGGGGTGGGAGGGGGGGVDTTACDNAKEKLEKAKKKLKKLKQQDAPKNKIKKAKKKVKKAKDAVKDAC